MQNELYEIFRRNFPLIVREEGTALAILGHEANKIIEKRNEQDKLIGVSVINQNTILMLCVDREYRNQGIGTELLAMTERLIREAGFTEINVGVGFDYLMPGVPTDQPYYQSENANLYPDVDDTASRFFTKRGYVHSWDCDCFDMRFPLEDFTDTKNDIGVTAGGITYRWAVLDDLEKVCRCTDDACREFTQYYQNQELYGESNAGKVLIAAVDNEVAGTLIVNVETEAKGLGSVGCTTVRPAYQGRHIAVNLVTLGTKYLKDIGLKEAYLGYTYTGLDHLYGYAGYKICIYYMMAKKRFENAE